MTRKSKLEIGTIGFLQRSSAFLYQKDLGVWLKTIDNSLVNDFIYEKKPCVVLKYQTFVTVTDSKFSKNNEPVQQTWNLIKLLVIEDQTVIWTHEDSFDASETDNEY